MSRGRIASPPRVPNLTWWPVRVGALWGLVLLAFIGAPVRAQDSCAGVVEQAEARYVAGAFEEAIRLISSCTGESVIAPDEVLAAHRLLALSYLHEGNTAAAKLALVLLLALDPTYDPDFVQDPPPYTALVVEVKRDLGLPSAAEFRCDREVAEAEAHYEAAAYDEAISLLTACLSKPELAESETVRAHRLLALSYLKQGALAPARRAVAALLTAVPDYQVDAVQDLPAYVSLVEIVRGQRAEGSAP